MIFTYNRQTVNLLPGLSPPSISLSLSGGADSAALAFLLSKYFPQIELRLFHSNYSCDRPGYIYKDIDAAKAVRDFLAAQFPENSIPPLRVFEYSSRPLTDAQVIEIRKDNPERYALIPDSKLIKPYAFYLTRKILAAEDPTSFVMGGITLNPPRDTMERLGFAHMAELNRDPGAVNVTYPNTPFKLVDKRFVAGVYKEHGLLTSLLPLTRSCNQSVHINNPYTHVCGQCFWCLERNWAFNTNHD